MKRAAIVIGVDATGTLPKLGAAAAGATKFAKWAAKQGFSVELLTDQSGSVDVSAIKKAIKKFLSDNEFLSDTYSQLVVYFSGHGVLRGPDYELWLLSGAPADPSEAVIVSQSINYARNSGVAHIVFISDACRSIPNSLLINGVTGSSIFPNQESKRKRPDVDQFYAARPGDVAYEVPVKDAVENYRALFTECLLGSLENPTAEVVEHLDNPPPPRWVITPWALKKYLEMKVPLAAQDIHIKLVQDPEVRVESHNPEYLVECPNYGAATPPDQTPPVSTPPLGINLNHVLIDAEPQLRRVIGSHVRLAVYQANKDVHIRLNPTQVKQTILNMAENARDAMPNGGDLVIEAKRVDLRKALRTPQRLCPPGAYMELSVGDTGIGMSSSIQKRVFEPCFTTKQNAKGLGLTIAHNIAEKAGGGISVHSQPGKGTTFKLYFPVAEPPIKPSRAGRKKPRPPVARAREKAPQLGDYLNRIQTLPSTPKDLLSMKLEGGFAKAFEPSKVQGDIALILNAKGRQYFKTRTGFTVVGTTLKLASVRGIKIDPPVKDSRTQQVQIHWVGPPRPGRSLLLQFQEGTGTVLAPLSGFIGTVTVDNGRVVNVSYVPAPGSGLYPEYAKKADEISKRHAYIAAAAGNGSFRIDPAKAKESAQFLRLLKGVDPTLGLYAAYAYAQVGAQDGVNSVFEYMSQAPEPVLFDVALLANKLPTPIRMQPSVAPFCPMLTQGWAMLAGQEIASPLKEARPYLVPALWTTFAPAGVDILRRAMDAGELL